MLFVLLLAASLVPASQAIDCADGGDKPPTAQTQPMRGPAGVSAVLKVSSADDHSKNSHECEADYQLVITAGDAAPITHDLLASDDAYGRRLSVDLSGFSQDGKLLFGILSEGGPHPSITLFVYDTTNHGTQLIDLRERFARIVAPACDATFAVVGTAKKESIVIEVDSAKHCAAQGRWLLNTSNNTVERFPAGAPMQNLYEPQLRCSLSGKQES